jgi:putative DNA primase/helicase
VPFPHERGDEDRDNRFRDELTDPVRSGAAVLAWALEGCRLWRHNGLGISDDVRAATDDYRRSQDDVAEFLADRCVCEPSGAVRALTLRQAYETWCREEARRPVTGKRWAQALAEKGLDRSRRHGGVTHWIGVAIKDGEPSPGEGLGEGQGEGEPAWVREDLP